jgi:hypothetical protein
MSRLYTIHKMLYKNNRFSFSNNIIDFNSIQLFNLKKNTQYPFGAFVKNDRHTFININYGSTLINMIKFDETNQNKEISYVKADCVNVYNNSNSLICNSKYILSIYPNVLFNINSIDDCNLNIYSSSDSFLQYFNNDNKLIDIEYLDNLQNSIQ